MKKPLFLLVLFFLCVSCSNPASLIDTRSTEQIPTSIQLPTSTAVPMDQGQLLIHRSMVCIDKYSNLIADEMQTKNYEMITLSDGTQGVNFLGETRAKVTDAFTEMQECVRKHNLEYTRLYKTTHKTPPLPDGRTAQQKRLAELRASLGDWLEKERKNGEIVEIYSPFEMKQIPLLIGSSYAKSMLIEDELKNLELALAGISSELLQFDAEVIKKLDNGDVSLLGVSAFPYYRMDIKLTSYETTDYYYTLYSNQHAIIEVIPKRIPLSADLTPISPKSADELEQKARTFIASISPNIELDMLTAVPGSKIGSFFFRWEDRTKPVLDDGMSYPFVQVAYNADGELLNYYNTLSLSH